VLYSPDDIRGVQTRAVSGEHVPLTALQQMLAGTSLQARQDAKTKAISIIARPSSRDPPENDTPAKPTPSEPPKPPLEKMKKSFSAHVSALFATLGASILTAQIPTDPAGEEPVVLSPFVINSTKDY